MRTLVLFGTLALAGCAVIPLETPAPLEAPTAWQTDTGLAPVSTTTLWWTDFRDPVLNTLVDKALGQNLGLQASAARVREARGARMGARAEQWPTLSATAGATRRDQGAQAARNPQTLYEAGFDASFEIDLFGATAARRRAAEATLAATEAERDAAALTLASEVLRTYMDWREASRQLSLTESTLAAQSELAALTRDRLKAGIANDLEVAQAEALTRSTAAFLPLYREQRDTARFQLGVLLGLTPPALAPLLPDTAAPLPVVVGVPSLGAPAATLVRRPDLRAAEQRLASARETRTASVRDLFPKLSLAGLFGVQDLRPLGDDAVWSAGLNLAQPVLNFGRLHSRIDRATAQAEQAFFTWQEDVVRALAEVETALVAVRERKQRRLALADVQSSERRTLALAEARYQQGITPFLDVLLAQKSVFEAERTLATAQADEARALIALHKALGIGP